MQELPKSTIAHLNKSFYNEVKDKKNHKEDNQFYKRVYTRIFRLFCFELLSPLSENFVGFIALLAAENPFQFYNAAFRT